MKIRNGHQLNREQFGIEEELFLTLESLKERKSAQFFIEPVNADEIPDYYEIILNPIDLLAIQVKLKKGLYKYSKQVKSDLMLIIQNSKKYNAYNDNILKVTEKFASCISTEWKIFLATLSKKGIPYNSRLQLSLEVLNRISKIEEKRNKIKVLNLNLKIQGELNQNENIYYSTLSAVKSNENTIEQTKSENYIEALQNKSISIKDSLQSRKQMRLMIVLDQTQINSSFKQMAKNKIDKYKVILDKKLNWLKQKIIYKMMKSQKYNHLVVLPYLDKRIESLLVSQTIHIRQLQAIIKQMAYFVQGYKHVLSDRMKQKFVITCQDFRACLVRILKYMQIHDILVPLQNSYIKNEIQVKSEIEENKQLKISKIQVCIGQSQHQRKFKYLMSDFKKLYQKDRIKQSKNQTKNKLNRQQSGSVLLSSALQNFDEIEKKNKSCNKVIQSCFRFDIPKENDEKVLQQQLLQVKTKDKLFIEQYKKRSNITIIRKFSKDGFSINWQKAVEVKKEADKLIKFYI